MPVELGNNGRRHTVYALPSVSAHRPGDGGTTIPVALRTESTIRQKPARPQLMAETELLYHILVADGIVSLEVVEQATPLADQHEKAAA